MAETTKTTPVTTPPVEKTGMARVFDAIERVGNKIPHAAILFAWMIVIVIVLSHICYLLGLSVTYESINPSTHQPEQVTTAAQSLLTGRGISFMYQNLVQNFMNFTAVGVIIVAMLGVGVAEESGLIKALIRKLVHVAPRAGLTYILVFVGILSSIAADAGYLVLIPLGAAAFLSVGRNPLVGLAASFAAVASIFSVNILIKPLDGILVGITNDAIHLVNPNLSISLTSNFWFSVASVLMLTVVCGFITDKYIEPRLGPYHPPEDLRVEQGESAPAENAAVDESRGLKFATWGLFAILAVFVFLCVPRGAPLRNSETGALVGDSPFMNGLIVFIALLFLVVGAAYGFGAKTMKGGTDVVKAMEKAVVGLGPLLFLFFFIAQFIALFTYSNMATLLAVKGGDWLERLGFGPIALLIGFVVIVLFLDLFITGAIPKWAIFAPVFVPMLMRLHVRPEAVLAAYRMADSPVNAITPMMAYFPLVVGFAAKYDKKAGVGTVVAMMLPYVIVISAVWIVLLIVWQLTGLPWGF
ncbi:MAG: AbgT family transporter [Bryobacterales bacterium]|nr:AbgT family transporter [Bryobacterales bacterium]MBV9398136.1 AbgT family transporter [Bryobacterales bacterium]